MNSNVNSIFQAINLTEYEHNLYSVNTAYADRRLEYYKIQAQTVNADYFYCFNNLIENQPIPFIYIYDQRKEYKKRDVDLIEINKKLWTLGEIALAIVIYDDGFKIIDTRHPIKSESEPAFLDNISQSIKKIDSILKHRIFEGRILEESPADYVSVSPYQKLLEHIEKAILIKAKKIGCRQDLLKKLLVKFILIKYLEEQVDDEGNSVFEDGFFDKFINNKKNDLFSKEKSSFCDVLRGNDVAGLLSFLNRKFNGGIFNLSEQEEIEIRKADLHIIADALDGDKDIDGQMSIWRYYDFNLLPIEFISRLYERFVTSVDGKQKSTGAYYTPPHLARLLIDELLPFDKDIDFKDFKILDPSCGSGIFLVLAYKRLITLWLLKNGKQTIRGEEDIKNIKEILSDCIYGIDINDDALSITATSLQIELSSHIRPKEIWEKLTFDNLEEQGNLTNQGFFKWYKSNPLKFDAIAGNPPFNISKEEQQKNIKLGKDDDFTTEKYKDYDGKLQSFPHNNPALIFLYRCLNNLLNENAGSLFLVMPSSSLIYTPSSSKYRKSLAHHWNIKRVYDFTPLRDHLWGKTKIATVAIKVSNEHFTQKPPIEHIIVRNSSANEKGAIRFQIDKYDTFSIPIDFVYSKDFIWKTNLFGGGYLRQFIEKYEHKYLKISHLFGRKGAKVGYQRDKSTTDSVKLREEARRVINLNKQTVIDSNLFDNDIFTDRMTITVSGDDWVRIPEYVSDPPNILIRLNVNLNIPIFLNRQNIFFPKGILGLKCDNEELMRNFVSVFKQNRQLYSLLIKLSSSKVFIQQGNAYSIDAQDILRLPINLNKDGEPILFEEDSYFEKVIIEDASLWAENLNKSDSVIFKGIDYNTIHEYGKAFCEIINLTYEKGDYKFKPIRQIINDDYVWTTFEHTNQNVDIEKQLTNQNKQTFKEILHDHISNNALTINRVITYYGIDNQIALIKPNKLKYWMRTIAYRDAENVKSEMFKNGY